MSLIIIVNFLIEENIGFLSGQHLRFYVLYQLDGFIVIPVPIASTLIIRCFITTLSSTLEGTTPRRITIHGNFILIIRPNVAIVVTLVS